MSAGARRSTVHVSTFVVLGGWFFALAAVGAVKRTELAVTAPPPPPPPPSAPPMPVAPAPIPWQPPPPAIPDTACGDPAREPRRVEGWTSYVCRSAREVGLGRPRCLGWRSYASARDQGCPGDLICCPSAPLAGAAPVPGELCVHDVRPPLVVRAGPTSSDPSVGELENDTRVHATHPEGQWMHIDAPVSGWVYIPWLAVCGARGTQPAEPPASDERDESEASNADPFAAARAALRARRVEAAVDAITSAQIGGHALPDDVRQELTRLGSNTVGNRLLAGDCTGAQALYRRLRSVGAEGTAGTQFGDWCAVPP